MAGFLFRLQTVEGEPAEPPTLSAAVPNWKPGDTIHLGKRTPRVGGLRDEDGDSPPVIVEDAQGWRTGRIYDVGAGHDSPGRLGGVLPARTEGCPAPFDSQG
jgi:hypothetical protein